RLTDLYLREKKPYYDCNTDNFDGSTQELFFPLYRQKICDDKSVICRKASSKQSSRTRIITSTLYPTPDPKSKSPHDLGIA
ncbi:913_t:CDS:2, partial [Funneliformis caledonium]